LRTLGALWLASILAGAISTLAPDVAPRHLQPFALPTLQPGDLVFVGADSVFWAKAASMWSTPEHRFGHVGVYALDAHGQPEIVHAGGSPTDGDAPVTAEPLTSYLALATRVGVYRLRAAAPDARARIADAALEFVDEHAVFDGQFSLSDRHRLYCTALAWRAVLEGSGNDIAPHKSSIGGRTVVTLADLEQSPRLQLIAFLSRQ
jgi:hypothetical protein